MKDGWQKILDIDGHNYERRAYRVTVLLNEKGLMECIEQNIEEDEYFTKPSRDTPEVKAKKKRKFEQRRQNDRKYKSLYDCPSYRW